MLYVVAWKTWILNKNMILSTPSLKWRDHEAEGCCKNWNSLINWKINIEKNTYVKMSPSKWKIMMQYLITFPTHLVIDLHFLFRFTLKNQTPKISTMDGVFLRWLKLVWWFTMYLNVSADIFKKHEWSIFTRFSTKFS